MPPKKVSAAGASPSKASPAKDRANTQSTKRKLEPIVVSSDSEIEVIEKPTPAKKKRVVAADRNATPPPNSQAYKDLPAVSVSSLVLAAMKSAVTSSGGTPTFDLQELQDTSAKLDKQDATPSRPERVKTKTEKAAYAEKIGVDSSGALKDSSTIKRTKGKGKEVLQLDVSPLVAKATTSAVKISGAATPEISDFEWPSTPVRSIKFEEREDWSDQEPDISNGSEDVLGNGSDSRVLLDVSQKESGDAISADFEDEDPILQVMLKSIQDPDLAPIYEGLPDLGIYRSVRQYAYVSTVGMGVVALKDIQNRVANDDISRLVRALLFTKSGVFVNPARAAPDVFFAEHGRLKLKDPASVAVCVMTGIVTDCAILSEGFTGGPDNEKAVHKISIAPFRQEFRRDTTMWGKILNFDNISCAVSTEGLSFTTKPRTLSAPIFSSSVPSSPKTPKKKGSRAMTVMLSPAPPRRADNFITSRSFEQRVPIYDGRSAKGVCEFTFSDADFSKLSAWPLYENGLQDLPYDAIVSVGYTLNTFGEGPRGGPNGLSTNLHFVMLLALPDE